MARLYANETFPLAVVEALRGLGHDVVTVREADRDNQRIGDDDVLAYAAAESRAVITLNRRDFIRLHRQNSAHCGVIVCAEDADTEGQARRVDEAIVAIGDLVGQLVGVNRPGR